MLPFIQWTGPTSWKNYTPTFPAGCAGFGFDKKAFAGITGSYTHLFGDVLGGTVDLSATF